MTNDTRGPAAFPAELAADRRRFLAILKEKTRGNLNDDEDRLLESLLYELRMRYVRETAK